MKNLQYLATEIFKVKNGLTPIIMNEAFNFQENERYSLGSGIHLASGNMHTARFGTDTISSLEPKLWKLITDKKNKPQHYQLLKPRLNLGLSTAAHVVYAKYLLRMLILLKFVRVSNGIRNDAYSFIFKKKLFKK